MAEPARGAAPTIAGDEPTEAVFGTGRERILEVALEEFAANGFEGTSMARIARRAGVTQPLVHYHFASKDALWRAAVDDVSGRVTRDLDAVHHEMHGLPPAEQLELVIRAMVRFHAACPEFGRIVAHEGARGGDRLTYLLEREVDVPNRDVGQLLQRGVEDGWAKPLAIEHVVVAAAAAVASVFVITEVVGRVYGLDVHDPAVVESHADTVVELILHGLLVDDDRGSRRA